MVDGAGNVYVLNRGNGNNGSLLQFDPFGALLATKATGLTNATGLALDINTNLYVAVRGNTVIRITPLGVTETIGTVTNAGASLQGIVVTDSGYVAACDGGRHGILLINPATGSISNLTGFNGAGDQFGTKNNARFRQPTGITKAGGDLLIVSDFGNNRVKVISPVGTVTNLYGVSSNFWYTGSGSYPGWWDGTVCTVDAVGCPEGRQPVGLAFAADGSVYSTEVFYHLIRKTTSTGLPPPPPPPTPVTTPQIGWVDFEKDIFGASVSVLRVGQSFVFNNEVIIAVLSEAGTETYFTYGPTPTGVDNIPTPGRGSGSTPPPYEDGLPASLVAPSILPPQPDVTLKAISVLDGRPDSAVTKVRFQFKAANPTIFGDNAAAFVVTNQTLGSEMWYTTDGSDPTNTPGGSSIGPISGGASLSLNVGNSNLVFKIRAFRPNFQNSGIITKVFSTNSFIPNSISFGFAGGEASSDFVASPGQTFYAPVTLNVVPDTKIYSLQFNVTVTTNVGTPNDVEPGKVGFESMLMKPDPANPGLFLTIPPSMFLSSLLFPPPPPPPGTLVHPYSGGWYADLRFTNSTAGSNLVGVGWLERRGKTNLYNTTMQDLIKYSLPHDTLFDEDNGKIVPGGYMFQVPALASPGDQYVIKIGRPSATSDGIGAPGSDVYIATPTNGSLAGGAINSIKVVTVGQRKYLVGDAAPFRWFNAGDFGNSNLLNDDVMQIFQSAIYFLNQPPPGSDFEDAMDSCCGTFTPAPGTDYLVATGGQTPDANLLFNGDDTDINSIAFGDGVLDVSDIYVTFRRSLDPSLQWFRRFWTNGVRVAQTYPNQAPTPIPLPPPLNPNAVAPEVKFTAGDGVVAAGQTVYIPISAQIRGDYPLRLLALGLTVEPLDGSPTITSQVQFIPNNALGSPSVSSPRGAANYSAVWLNNAISGLTGEVQLGLLQVTLPANCPSNAAYAVHFDHASGSPNGLASFPRSVGTGLITLRDRSASSWNDGISDSWRLRYFGTLNNILAQGEADADGDSANNWHEFKAGTNPNDANSLLKARSAKGAGQSASIQWPSVLNKQYVVERAASLYSPVWTPVSTNTGTGWTLEYQDPAPGGAQFYRVRVQP